MTSRVWRRRSNETESADEWTTVRQQPLTATLSPRESSEAKGTPESVSLAPPREGVRETTLAVDSTMPVNIGVTGHGRRRCSTGIGGGVGRWGGQGGFLHRGE